MRNVLVTLLLLLFLAGNGWAQTPSNGQTNIPNWLWVKPTVVDRTTNAFCVWGGISISTLAACDMPVIATDGGFTTHEITLDYQTGGVLPTYSGTDGLYWVTPTTDTWDWIHATKTASEHGILIESKSANAATLNPFVTIRAEEEGLSAIALTSWEHNGASSRIRHEATTHTFNNQATFANIQVSTDSDLRGDVYDGAGTFTIADNVQVNGFLDLYNGGPIKSTTTDVTIDDTVIITGSVSDSNSALTIADALTAGPGDHTFSGESSVGSVGINDSTNTINLNVRPASGKIGCLSFTEDSVNDRWAFTIPNGSSALQLRQGSCTGTIMWEWDSAGNITTDQTTGTITFGDATNKFETLFLSLDGIGTGIVDVVTNSTGELFYDSSTARIKKAIENHPPKNQATLSLQPRLYLGKDAPDTNPKTLGLIAEEIPPDLQQELVTKWKETRVNPDGTPYEFEVVSVNYKKLSLLLLEVVKEHEARLVALEARIAALEKKP